MSKSIIKYSCIFTLSFIIFYLIFPIIPFTMEISSVKAAGINEEDVYKGLGVALILILVSKLGQSNESSPSESRDIIIEKPDSEFTDEDINLLARLIHGESRGEPYEGQVAVGAVVLNRVKSPDFPNTIRGVVYQDNQFTAVSDGQINLAPNNTAFNAAADAINGVDPSLGALFFYNPKTAKTIHWLSQRDTTVIIGNHVFAR